MNATTDGAKMITEEIHVAGNELIDRVKGLINEGRVRHIRVKGANGETYFELPLAVGLLGGAALAWASPFLAMAGALTGLVSSVKLEVVRDSDAVEAIEGAAKDMAEKAWSAATAAKKTATRAAKGVASKAERAVKGAASTVKRAAAKAPATAKRVAAKAPSRAVAAAKKTATKAGKTAAKTTRGKAKSTAKAKSGRR